MLQAGGLQPARHDSVAGIGGRPRRIVEGSGAGVVIQSSGGCIALLHLATHVALRPSLGRQFSRSVFTNFATNTDVRIQIRKPPQYKKNKNNNNNRSIRNTYDKERIGIEKIT